MTFMLAQVERWNPCPPLPGCISVNIGDPLQFWSDGILKSNYHRVRMPLPGETTVSGCHRLLWRLLTHACTCMWPRRLWGVFQSTRGCQAPP